MFMLYSPKITFFKHLPNQGRKEDQTKGSVPLLENNLLTLIELNTP